jgi:hypothetical protein
MALFNIGHILLVAIVVVGLAWAHADAVEVPRLVPSVKAVDVAARQATSSGGRGVCNLFCILGSHCVINKCQQPKCVSFCDGFQCGSGQVCRVVENAATCVTNPCFLAKCGSAKPNCVVENGSAVCKSCPVNIRFEPVCCKLLDGTLKTLGIFECGCTVSGTTLFPGSCPDTCKCPPRSSAKNDVCCRLKDGTVLSIPDCECKCRRAAEQAPNPTSTPPPSTTPPPTATPPPTKTPLPTTTSYPVSTSVKNTPACMCPVTTQGICCLGKMGDLFFTGSDACCRCLGGSPLGKICPVIDPAPTPPPTMRR